MHFFLQADELRVNAKKPHHVQERLTAPKRPHSPEDSPEQRRLSLLKERALNSHQHLEHVRKVLERREERARQLHSHVTKNLSEASSRREEAMRVARAACAEHWQHALKVQEAKRARIAARHHKFAQRQLTKPSPAAATASSTPSSRSQTSARSEVFVQSMTLPQSIEASPHPRTKVTSPKSSRTRPQGMPASHASSSHSGAGQANLPRRKSSSSTTSHASSHHKSYSSGLFFSESHHSAARRIQKWYRHRQLGHLSEAFASEITAKQLLSSKPAADSSPARKAEAFEQMSQLLQSPVLLKHTQQLLRSIAGIVHLERIKNPHRMFLSAFMMVHHPEATFSSQHAEDIEVRERASAMIAAFSSWVALPLETRVQSAQLHAFAHNWKEFVNAFQAWKDADARRLVDGLVLHHRELSALRHTVSPRSADSPQARDWFPHIRQQQLAIEKRLQVLGATSIHATLVEERRAREEATASPSQSPSEGRIRTVSNEGMRPVSPVDPKSPEQAASPGARERSRSNPLSPPPPSTAGGPATTQDDSQSRQVRHSPEEPISSASSPDGQDEAPQKAQAQAPAPSGPTEDEAKGMWRAVEGLMNASLAHEVAVDPNFSLHQLEKMEAEVRERAKTPKQLFEERVRAQMKRAFFDLVGEDLAKSPPDFRRVLSLIQDIHAALLAITLPSSQHDAVRRSISERLDPVLIQQQMESGSFDHTAYATYVLDTMKRLCAPVRDVEVEALRRILAEHKIPEFFQEALELLQKMRVDLADYYIQSIRPLIQKHAVEIEQAKFREALGAKVVGLDATRAWLELAVRGSAQPGEQEEHRAQDGTSAQGPSYAELLEMAFAKTLLNGGFGALSSVGSSAKESAPQLPETWAMDQERLHRLSQRVRSAILVASLHTVASTLFPLLRNDDDFSMLARQQLPTLLASGGPLEETLPMAVAHILQFVQRRGRLSSSSLDEKRALLEKVGDSSHPVFQLLSRRVEAELRRALKESFAARVSSASTNPYVVRLRPNTGLDIVSHMLVDAFQQATNLFHHNRETYAPFYDEILHSLLAV